jgi:hypothetical protein
MRLILSFAFVLIFATARAQSQVPILDRHVSVSFTNEKMSVVLARIGQQGGFSFSYNASIIPDDQVATINLTDKTVREVLNELFKGSINYKEKGNHLILSKVSVKQTKSSIMPLIISGYVENGVTREKIVDASIYEKVSISSVLSDEFGFFRLRIDKKPEEAISISISKKDYRDTTIVIEGEENQYFHVSLVPLIVERQMPVVTLPAAVIIDTVSLREDASAEPSVDDGHDQEPQHEELILPYQAAPNVQNISDTLHRWMQFSILPFVGTNGRMSGNVINDYSANLFGGYSMGTRYVELGGFFNIDRGDASMLQVAGMANLNGGNMYGLQVGGFFNFNGGQTKAIQVGGFANVNYGDAQGVQVAGFSNINFAAAHGVQVAGLANYANGASEGVQVAGLANVHIRDFSGPMIAGLTNINYGTVRGSQISGLFNYGHRIYGTQIGFINSADSLTGIPIGFMSFVRHGYHKIELSADEVFYFNVAFRTGVRQFYNIIFAGVKPDEQIFPDVAWTAGYGLGTAPRLIGRWLSLNLDITGQQLFVNGNSSDLSFLTKAHLGLDFQITRKFSIYAGVALNGYFTRLPQVPFPTGPLPGLPGLNPQEYPMFRDYEPDLVFDEDVSSDVNLKMWWGPKIALRFL